MKAVRALPAAVVHLLVAISSSRAAESAALACFEQSRAIVESIPPQLAIEQALYLEELAAGAARGEWSPVEKDALERRIQEVIEETSRKLERVPNDRKPRGTPATHLEVLIQAKLEDYAQFPPSQRFYFQLSQFARTEAQARSTMRQSACNYAEEIWLAARKPADLAPAVRVLAEAKSFVEMSWSRLAFARSYPTPRGVPAGFSSEGFEILDFLSVIGSPVSLLPPDPIADTVGFLAMRNDWLALRQSGHSFASRPAVAARFAELDSRLATEIETVREKLYAAVLNDASSADFDGLLKRLVSLTPPRPAPLAPKPPSFQSGSRPTTAQPDYRQLISAETRPNPIRMTGQKPGSDSAEVAAFKWWLAFQRAEKAGDASAFTRNFGNQLLILSPLPNAVVQRIFERVGSTAKKSSVIEPVPADVSEPVAALLAAFARLKASLGRSGGDVAIEPLIQVWKNLADGGPARAVPDSVQLFHQWTSLAKQPGALRIFQLREKAAQHLLVRMPTAANTPESQSEAPLESRIREHLDAAFRDGAWDYAGRLLALDAASSALDPQTHANYARALDRLLQAEKQAGDGRPDEARRNYLALLREIDLPEIGPQAARKASALPRADSGQ